MARPRRSRLEVAGDKILKAARAAGAAQSYYFETTFARYRRQLKLLAELEEVLDESDLLVEKSYVKGRANLYANPAIAQYNATADAANRTMAALLRIVDAFKPDGADRPPGDELMDFIDRK